MSTQKKFFSLRIQPETYEAMRTLAFTHRRSIAAEMEQALLAYITACESELYDSLPAAAHCDGYATAPEALQDLHRQLMEKHKER